MVSAENIMRISDDSLDAMDCRPLTAEPVRNPYLARLLADYAAKRADKPSEDAHG
jgi:hypothetical protein